MFYPQPLPSLASYFISELKCYAQALVFSLTKYFFSLYQGILSRITSSEDQRLWSGSRRLQRRARRRRDERVEQRLRKRRAVIGLHQERNETFARHLQHPQKEAEGGHGGPQRDHRRRKRAGKHQVKIKKRPNFFLLNSIKQYSKKLIQQHPSRYLSPKSTFKELDKVNVIPRLFLLDLYQNVPFILI